MSFPRPLIQFVLLGFGPVGCIACAAAIICLWSVSSRLRHTSEAVFERVDNSLVVIQERAKRTHDRVQASAITTENIAASLKEWTKREAAQQLAVQLNLAEKSDKLRLAMQQADEWMELSASSAESVQQALSFVSALGAQIDTGIVDAVIDEISALRVQLTEATEFVEKIQEQTAATLGEETLEERIPRAIQLAVRVIATLSSVDSRLEKFATRLLETQNNLQALKIKTIEWIWVVTIIITMLITWMAAGQVALSWFAWKSLRSA
jgi:flagellin-like hook-associated protein FlgL